MRYCLFILSIITFFSCKKGTFDAGNTVIKERVIANVHQIILYDNINLILTQDTVEKLRIEAGENIQNEIATDINGAALTIKNTSSNQWLQYPAQKINCYVSIKQLRKIDYKSAGNITSTNTLQSDYFQIDSEGAGDVRLSLNSIKIVANAYQENADLILSGRSDTCYAYCSSRGTIDFRNLQVRRMAVDFGSVRDGYVWATEALHAQIFYKGNLYYKGTPTVDMQLLHDGRLFRF
ncbi:MAG: hypothetical protein C4329_02815 [Chitinophagaceae bacterium]